MADVRLTHGYGRLERREEGALTCVEPSQGGHERAHGHSVCVVRQPVARHQVAEPHCQRAAGGDEHGRGLLRGRESLRLLGRGPRVPKGLLGGVVRVKAQSSHVHHFG